MTKQTTTHGLRAAGRKSALMLATLLLAVLGFGGAARAQNAPTGPAGGDLAGTYPNPTFATDRVRKTGDSMTGALDIALPNSGGIFTPLTLSTNGNSLAGRGTAFGFNVPLNAASFLGGKITTAWGTLGQTYMSFGALNNVGTYGEVFRLDGRGFFGFNTSNPTSRLHVVSGTDSATSMLALDTGTHGGTSMTVAGTAANESTFDLSVHRSGTYVSRFGVGSAGNVYLQPGGGNVGIGTSSPGAPLDVRGSIALDGIVPATHISTYPSLWLKNNVALIPEAVAGHSILNIGTNYQRTSTAWTYVDQSIPTWVLSMGGGPTWDQFQVSRSSGSTYNSVKFLVVNSAGNVGIGAPTPAYKLDVAGQVRSSSGGFVFPDGTVQTSAAAASSPSGWTDGGTSVTMTNATAKIGIGTANPSYKLHVSQGSAGIQNTGGDAVLVTTSGTANESLTTGWSSSGFGYVQGGVWGGAVKNVVLQGGGGNVGIGTTTPQSSLDVAGGSVRLSNATSNKVYFGMSGVGAPGAGSAGEKMQLYGTAGSVQGSDYALGIEAGNMWSNSGGGYKWYSNSASKMTLDAAGNLNVTGAITGATVSATYQDVAEWVPSTQKLSAGTVVVLDASKINHVLASTSAYDTKVAGVISDCPGVILGEGGEDKLKVATTGRVKVKVDATRGPIKVGDLLVTSGAEGVAMKSVEVDLGGVKIHRPGTIIGKALEPLANGTGEILVLLSLQ